MPELYAVVGHPNCKKSSTIRALTGAGRRGMRLVATGAGTLDFFVQITSLQEAHRLPAAFSAEMLNAHADRILAPLWIDSLTYSGVFYPQANVYL